VPSFLLSEFGAGICEVCPADIEGNDGDVDLADLGVLLAAFGAVCR
jgi:hypothetical protein